MTSDQSSGAAMPDDGILHRRGDTFGKSPDLLIHDLEITDGATRLYAHMHWRYGGNKRNFEGLQSMGESLGVSENAIVARIQELEAKDWVVVVERDYNKKTGKYQTPLYHVFEDQQDCRDFRETYEPRQGEAVRAKSESRKRKLRKGVGGNLKNLKREARKEAGNVSVNQLNSSSAVRTNLSSDVLPNSSSAVRTNLSWDYLDSLYPDSAYPDTLKENTFPAGAGVSVFNQLMQAYIGACVVSVFIQLMEAYVYEQTAFKESSLRLLNQRFRAVLLKHLAALPEPADEPQQPEVKPMLPPISESQAAVIYTLGLKRPEYDDKPGVWSFLNQWGNFFAGTVKKNPTLKKQTDYYNYQLSDFNFTPVQIVAYKLWYQSEYPDQAMTMKPETIQRYAGLFWLSPRRAHIEKIAEQKLAEFIEKDKLASMPPLPQPEPDPDDIPGTVTQEQIDAMYEKWHNYWKKPDQAGAPR